MIFAWAHGVGTDEAPALAARFPGLGLVLYPTNYGAATDLAVPPIAYVTTIEHARVVRTLATTGTPFAAAIVDDERNADGPSGSYLTPAEYARRFAPIYDTLKGVVPVHTMGLAPVGSWWNHLTWDLRFDHAYHQQLPPAVGRAFNPNKVHGVRIREALDRHAGPWILSPAPFRGWWERLRSTVTVRDWARLSAREDVTAVALWCLKEVQYSGGRWQSEHGLLDRHGQVTNVGREVLAALP